MGLFDADARPPESEADFWKRYHAYINSPAWALKRKQKLRQTRSMCERCPASGHRRRATHVHHLTYERLGHELLTDLEALCNDCHADLHPEHADELRRQGGTARVVHARSLVRMAHNSTEWCNTGRAVTVYNCSVCAKSIKIGQRGLLCKALQRRMHESCWDEYQRLLWKDKAL